MVATSKHLEQATRGVDLPIALVYTPPDGEEREGLTIRAYLAASGKRDVPADTVTFDTATGEILATWQEATTAKLIVGTSYEARFVRTRAGDSRLFYVRRVQVQ